MYSRSLEAQEHSRQALLVWTPGPSARRAPSLCRHAREGWRSDRGERQGLREACEVRGLRGALEVRISQGETLAVRLLR